MKVKKSNLDSGLQEKDGDFYLMLYGGISVQHSLLMFVSCVFC